MNTVKEIGRYLAYAINVAVWLVVAVNIIKMVETGHGLAALLIFLAGTVVGMNVERMSRKTRRMADPAATEFDQADG
jgi:UDP-N-acetylmuramyl pentapeptide phosphotransferase/UDP-N-acetylglucosamine-1-phosphate transferase